MSLTPSAPSTAAPRVAPPAPFVPFDVTFGNGGVVDDATAALSNASPPVLLADGRIALTGYTTAPHIERVLAVLGADGRLDPSFGLGGRSVLGPGADMSLVNTDRVAEQPDGKLLVGSAFTSTDGTRRWSLSRTRATGGLDTSFNGDARVHTSFPGVQKALILSVVLPRPNGRILVVGSTTGSTLVAAQYLPNGSLDRQFGIEGKLQLTLPGADLVVSDGALDAQGRLVVAGASQFADSRADMLVARLRADGSLDPTFGFGGTSIVDFGIGSDGASKLAVDDDGRIVLAGTAQQGSEAVQPAVVRLQPDGEPDPTFGEGGMVRLDTGKEPDSHRVSGLALLTDGRIALAGHYMLTDADRKADPDYRHPQPFVAVLRAGGSPDASFDGGDGIAFLPRSLSSNVTRMVAQPDDKLLVHVRQSLVRLNPTTQFAALRLTIGADRNPAGPGPLQFKVTVHNDGVAPAGGIATFRASKAVSLVGTTNGVATVEANRIDVTAKFAAIPAGGAATLTLRTTVNGFEEGISLTGSINAGRPELDVINNSASITVSTSRSETI